MKLYALVENGRVHCIERLDRDASPARLAELFHPDLVAKLVPIDGLDPSPQQGWLYLPDGQGGGRFAPPPAPPAADRRRLGLALRAVTAAIPDALEETWALLGIDAAKLSHATQERLAQKQRLRAEIAALGG